MLNQSLKFISLKTTQILLEKSKVEQEPLKLSKNLKPNQEKPKPLAKNLG